MCTGRRQSRAPRGAHRFVSRAHYSKALAAWNRRVDTHTEYPSLSVAPSTGCTFHGHDPVPSLSTRPEGAGSRPQRLLAAAAVVHAAAAFPRLVRVCDAFLRACLRCTARRSRQPFPPRARQCPPSVRDATLRGTPPSQARHRPRALMHCRAPPRCQRAAVASRLLHQFLLPGRPRAHWRRRFVGASDALSPAEEPRAVPAQRHSSGRRERGRAHGAVAGVAAVRPAGLSRARGLQPLLSLVAVQRGGARCVW